MIFPDNDLHDLHDHRDHHDLRDRHGHHDHRGHHDLPPCEEFLVLKNSLIVLNLKKNFQFYTLSLLEYHFL